MLHLIYLLKKKKDLFYHLKCTECYSTFTTNKKLKCHTKLQYPFLIGFVCWVCNKTFQDEEEFISHMEEELCPISSEDLSDTRSSLGSPANKVSKIYKEKDEKMDRNKENNPDEKIMIVADDIWITNNGKDLWALDQLPPDFLLTKPDDSHDDDDKNESLVETQNVEEYYILLTPAISKDLTDNEKDPIH